MIRKKGRLKHVLLLILGIEIFVLIAGLLYLRFRPMVAKAVTIEAGTKDLDIRHFLLDQDNTGTIITDIDSLDLNQPGKYEIQIKVGNRIHRSYLIVEDRIPPVGIPVYQTALLGEKLSPEQFVTDIVDATKVTMFFQSQPDTTVPGLKEVTIILKDAANNQSEIKTYVNVLEINSSVTVEAGTMPNIRLEDFIDTSKYEAELETDLSVLDYSKPRVHEVVIKVDGRRVSSCIEVIDTTPPLAKALNKSIWNDEKPEADYFVSDIVDVSSVQVYYKIEPDFTVLGNQSVSIVLEDEYGNKSELTAMAYIKKDNEAPVISGVYDRTVYIGNTISYKKNVIVTDNRDEDLDFQVDSSAVNLQVEGTYPVIYTATDSAGNTVSKSVNITVKKFEISEDELYAAVDEVLNEITNDQMTKLEVAYEIYQWIKRHVGYTGYSDKSDWMMEAYRGIKNGIGDCFTYFAVSKALLTRSNIDNMDITRVGGRTQHFWNLVNCGDGWYHFDACPHKDHLESFMLTDKEVDEYTEKRGNNYYTFDKSLYPRTPETRGWE